MCDKLQKVIDTVSYGKWEVTKWASHKDIHVSVRDFDNMIFVANFGNPTSNTLPTNPNAEGNAEIVCLAVNACKSINANNPTAVAQNIERIIGELRAYQALVGNTGFALDRETAKKLYDETSEIFKDIEE
jgi:hypothetical protein